MPLALSTGHQIGLGVTAAAFIAFALASSFLFPRFRPQYPGGGLLAFIVVAFVFFFGMLTAVEVFGAEEKEGGEEPVAEETTTEAPTTTQQQTTTAATTTQATTTVVEIKSPVESVVEDEFHIQLANPTVEAGEVTFNVLNDGKIPHDLAIVGVKQKTKLIPAGGSAKLTVTLKPGKYELYCSVPGHKAAGMDLKITVS